MERGAERTEVPFFFKSTVRLLPVGRTDTSIPKVFSTHARRITNPLIVPETTVPPCEYESMEEGPPPPPAEIVQLLSADKSYEVPLIVSVRVFGTSPERSWSPVFVPVEVPEPEGAPTSEAVSVTSVANE